MCNATRITSLINNEKSITGRHGDIETDLIEIPREM